MKIGIDARFYSLNGGLGRYVSELINQLMLLASEHEFYLFLPPGATVTNPAKRTHLIATNIPWYGWQEQVLWPRLLNRYSLDLVHFPHFNIPLTYRRPFVVTIHDLILLRQPTAEATHLNPLLFKLKNIGYKIALRRALKESRHIITTSQFTKSDIQQLAPIADSKISVTYQASRWTPTDSVEARRKQLLYVGNCYPHKNVALLIDTFVKFHSQNPTYSLVIAGHRDTFFSNLETRTLKSHAALPITFIPDCSDDELAQLYKTSELYIFPSRYEGFGLPGLEAMSFGLPVLSADSTCLPEIYGPAAHYFQNNNQTDLLRQMQLLCTDPNRRLILSRAGLERVRLYSWQQLAVDTLAIYDKVRN